ncbi:hypothetical protein SAMD00023353_0600220 [Rosellinia necatrix]|uniref:Uncharacterized protein n=1 Tax=Rosellinia necatrix TaxID=77044 RepID=A0A1S7UM76_ROSNE|nr:hypothetical protein SAMD00023353_0600220 [Rosellinia necatrix]
MAKERTKKEKARSREKKVSDDKVTKTRKQKKPAATTSDVSDDESMGGVPVEVESSDPMRLEETESSADKKNTEKSKKSKKKNQAETDGDDGPADGGAMLFSIDTNPTPVDLAAVKTVEVETEENPDKTKPPKGLNRQARRRIKLIEKQRELIKKKMGIPEGSLEQADEVQSALDKWIADLDSKTDARLEKKKARKAKEQARLKNKRGKLLTGRKLKEREKQLKGAEKKAAKKAAKNTGISGNNQ